MVTFTELPEELTERICSYVNFKDRLALALTNRQMHNIVKTVSSEEFLVINLNKNHQIRNNFWAHQVRCVQFHGNLVYSRMYTCLQKLRFIEVIDFTVIKIDRETAVKIVKTLKDLRRKVELIVDVDSMKYLSLAIAYSKGADDIALKVCRKRRSEEDENAIQREVSLVSNVMLPLKERLEEYERRLNTAVSAPADIIPSVLNKFGIPKGYCHTLQVSDLNRLLDSENNVHESVELLGRMLLESILSSNEGHFVLVTQLEIYYKDRLIDDTSINNIQHPNNNHLTRPVVAIERKTAMKASWYELKLYYQDFELLVTDGVYGRREEEKVNGFLGSSRVPNHLVKQTDWIVLSPISLVPVKKDTRLLQSFRNKASMFKWAFKSKKFVDLGFETEAPLLLYQHRQIDYYSIASFVLHCGSCGSITRSQLKDARRMLEEIDYYKYLGINKTASDPEIVKAVQESEKLGRARKWMLQLILEPNRSSDATNEDLTMLYKSFLYPKIASINNKRVEKLQ